MGNPAYNLVIVKGSPDDLETFEKIARKSESQAFCMEQLLPLPEYLWFESEQSAEIEAFRNVVYGSKWVAAFGILIEKQDSSLKYYFNSKWVKAQLDYVALKYRKLEFQHVFAETDTKFGVITYKNGERVLNFEVRNGNIDWHIVSDFHTWEYIEELFYKIMVLYKLNPGILSDLSDPYADDEKKYDFYRFYPRKKYLKDHEAFYDALYLMEQDLEMRPLEYARKGTAYNFRTNELYYKELFLKENFLPSVKKSMYLKNLEKTQKKSDRYQDWWNGLDDLWKAELVSNLLKSSKYMDQNVLPVEFLNSKNLASEIISDIVKLEKLHISRKLVFDLTPLSFMENLNDFHIQEPEYGDETAEYYIKMYPERLRSAVRKLNLDYVPLGNFTVLEDFVNLEELECQGCRLDSLEGIQKLTRLRRLVADQGNFYSDITPLRGIGIIHLNISFTNVTDLTPLMHLPALEELDLGGLENIDFSPLLRMPCLKRIVTPDFDEISPKQLKVYLKRLNILPHQSQGKNINRDPDFDHSKTWYLVTDFNYTEKKYIIPLHHPEDYRLTSFYEGQILEDHTLTSVNHLEIEKSHIRITDFDHLFGYLAEPFVFPVKIDKKCALIRGSGNVWFAGKVKLGKPVNVWKFFEKAPDPFPGSINLEGQPYIPQGTRFPGILQGDLKLYRHLLPSRMTLPTLLEGTFEIQYCRIPPAMRFPKKIKSLQIDSCSFLKNPDFRLCEMAELDIRNTFYPDTLLFPEIFRGSIRIEADTLTSAFVFPKEVKELVLSKVALKSGTELPEIVTGELNLLETSLTGEVIFPRKSKTIDLINCQFHENDKFPEAEVEEVLLSGCKLPKKYVLSNKLIRKITLEGMTIGAGLELNLANGGIIAFEYCKMEEGFCLPEEINGQISFLDCTVYGTLKFPAAGNYIINFFEGDDMAPFDIPDEVKSRVNIITDTDKFI